MDIVKQSESFVLTDTTDVFDCKCEFNSNVDGNVNIHLNVHDLNGNYIGNVDYSLYSQSNQIHLGVNCVKKDQPTLIEYANTVVDAVMNFINNNK